MVHARSIVRVRANVCASVWMCARKGMCVRLCGCVCVGMHECARKCV